MSRAETEKLPQAWKTSGIDDVPPAGWFRKTKCTERHDNRNIHTYTHRLLRNRNVPETTTRDTSVGPIHGSGGGWREERRYRARERGWRVEKMPSVAGRTCKPRSMMAPLDYWVPSFRVWICRLGMHLPRCAYLSVLWYTMRGSVSAMFRKVSLSKVGEAG